MSQRNRQHKKSTAHRMSRPPFSKFVYEGEYNGAKQYRNGRYLVGVFEYGDLLHLSIKHLEEGALNYLQDWRDYQRIKDELGGAEMEAVQIFPAQSRLVDGANQFHLWVLKKDRVPFGFDVRLVSEGDMGIGVTQRPFDPDNRPPDVSHDTFVTHPLAGCKPTR